MSKHPYSFARRQQCSFFFSSSPLALVPLPLARFFTPPFWPFFLEDSVFALRGGHSTLVSRQPYRSSPSSSPNAFFPTFPHRPFNPSKGRKGLDFLTRPLEAASIYLATARAFSFPFSFLHENWGCAWPSPADAAIITDHIHCSALFFLIVHVPPPEDAPPPFLFTTTAWQQVNTLLSVFLFGRFLLIQ